MGMPYPTKPPLPALQHQQDRYAAACSQLNMGSNPYANDYRWRGVSPAYRETSVPVVQAVRCDGCGAPMISSGCEYCGAGISK